jgi:Tfp pilus assembly protein PilV
VRRATQRGVSLIEAIVAMAVMAFGMMAIVGLQATLRQNSDIAKQRSEAVRIAEEWIEAARAFSVMAGYDGVGNLLVDPVPRDADSTNAVYKLTQTVVDTMPGMKSIQVEVSWVDRTGQIQSVTLNSIIAAADPALSGILTMAPGSGGGGLPATPPLGRNPAIPVQAKDLGNGKSGFKPPAPGGTVVWVFDNQTGVIVGVCNTVTTGQADLTQADVSSCSNNSNGLPLSGFVRFSTGTTQPTAADAEFPASTALNLAVVLTLSSTGHASPDHVCFSNAPLSASTTRFSIRYYCAILFNANAVPVWSGISTLTPLAFVFDLPPGYVPWEIADDAADARASRYRVCRYTPATSDAQVIPNQWHPRTYTNVTALEQLTNQNFLVIRAGDGPDDGSSGTAFTCPTDVPADPATGDFVNSNTLPHQPAPATP